MLITELSEMKERVERLNGDLATKFIDATALIIRLDNILHPRIRTVACSSCREKNASDAEWYRCDECGKRICPDCVNMMEELGDICPTCYEHMNNMIKEKREWMIQKSC